MKILKLLSLLIVLFILIMLGVITRPYQDIDVNSLFELNSWVHNNIEYKRDIYEYWQTPSETLSRGTGDCEDMVILFIDVAKKKFNTQVNAIFMTLKNNIISGHIAAIQENILYDPTANFAGHSVEYFLHYDPIIWSVLTEDDIYNMMPLKRRK